MPFSIPSPARDRPRAGPIANAVIPNPEVILKTMPPRMPRQPLERERLAQFRDASKNRAALLVTAPPGFGKTTLMLQWRMRWLAEGAAVAWYSVDASDNPLRFSAGVVHAVRQARRRADAAEEPAARAGLEALTILLAESVEDGRETVLMIDDAERLPDATLPALQYLMLNAPDNFHLVIGSRVPLALQTAELMAQGHVARVDADALRFRLEESLAVLERQLGSRLDTDQRARLHDATEGWPIGLQFAVAAIEHDPDGAAIRSFSAHRTGIQEYFDGTLFAHVPDDMAQVLTRIAVLDHFNAELLATMTDRTDADEVIERLAQVTPIAMVGTRSDWVRLHPLVRDVFRGRFEQLPAAEQAALHARASEWFMAHDYLHEAATHARAAGDEARAQEYAARSLWALGTWGMVDEAREWLDHIPDDVLARDTGLRLSAAMILSLSDRNEDGLRMAQDVVADPQSTPEMRVMALRVAGGAAAYADLLGLFPGIVGSWPDLPHMDPLYAMTLANARAFALLHAGQTAQARDVLARAAPTGEPGGTLRLAVPLGQMLFGMTYLWDGHPVLTIEALAPALARVEKTEGRRSFIGCAMASILAAALLQTGQHDAARAVLANRLDVIERNGFPDNALMAYRTLAHIALRRGDTRAALSALAELDALGVRRKLPRLRVYSLAERIRIHADEDCNETASELVEQLQALLPAFDEGAFAPLRSHVRVVAGIAMAHAAIARGAVDEADQLLRDSALETRPLHDGRDMRTILALQAVVARERGAADAPAALREAMRLAHIAGDEDFRAQLHPVALRMLAEQEGGSLVATPRPSARRRRRASARNPRTPADMLLTPKEVEVLGLLNQGMSNKRIALTLNVGGETVKWHMKNLYSKLSAVSRDHAIDRARLLGLIGG